MPFKVNYGASGEPLISIQSFSADEIRRLSGDADAEPFPSVREYCDNEGLVRVSNDAGFYGRQLQIAHDRLYETQRDAELEIQRKRDRTSQMAICAAIGWAAAFWLAVALWAIGCAR